MTKKIFDRLTKCDSGQNLNPLMHIFIFVTAVFSIAFLFFPVTCGIGQSVLYTQTLAVSGLAVNHWGIVGIITVSCHFIGLLIRGRVGSNFMRITIFGGFYMWLWASVVYLSGGFIFQFFSMGVSNLLFWGWYAWHWRKSKYNKDPNGSAFVN